MSKVNSSQPSVQKGVPAGGSAAKKPGTPEGAVPAKTGRRRQTVDRFDPRARRALGAKRPPLAEPEASEQVRGAVDFRLGTLELGSPKKVFLRIGETAPDGKPATQSWAELAKGVEYKTDTEGRVLLMRLTAPDLHIYPRPLLGLGERELLVAMGAPLSEQSTSQGAAWHYARTTVIFDEKKRVKQVFVHPDITPEPKMWQLVLQRVLHPIPLPPLH